MLTHRPLNKPSRALVATGSLLDVVSSAPVAFSIVPPNNCCDTGPEALACCTRWTRTIWPHDAIALRVRDVGIRQRLDVCGVGGAKSGNGNGPQVILVKAKCGASARLGAGSLPGSKALTSVSSALEP